MINQSAIRKLATASVIAAMYVALTVALPFISFGPIQCRISEALTVLPALTPTAIPGLAVGCTIANLIGIAANPVGAWDILIGSLATFLAAWLSYCLRNLQIKSIPVWSVLMPVLFNAVIVGGELALFLPEGAPWWLSMLQVGVGELLACAGLGIPLYAAIRRTKSLQKFL